MKLLYELNIQGRFLSGFSDGRRFHGFAIIDKAARKGPAERGMRTFNEYDAMIDLDNDIHRHQGVSVCFWCLFQTMLGDFGWTRALTSGAFSISMIMAGLLAVFMGRLTDRVGPRIVLTICGILLGLGYLLMSQVSSVWQLYLFYGMIIGAGMGGSYVPVLSSVAKWFSRRRGMMTGIIVSNLGLASLVAPPESWG